MLLYSIDEKTGNIFNITENNEYVHFIDGVQSTSLLYIKKIFLLSYNKTLKISMPNSDIFTLLNINVENKNDISKVEDIEINEFKWKELEEVFPEKNVMPVVSYTSKGVPAVSEETSGTYIHCVYILAQSQQGGTFVEDINVSSVTVSPETIVLRVGADFYEENEVLKVNLQNFGIEIPEVFTKAVYQTNVHDDATDFIVLNRKRKELLNEYKNIEYQKGNYNSLENALTFWEWGDKLKLGEFWQVLNEFNEQLFERDITKLMNEEIRENLDSMTKKTIIGIHCALDKYIKKGKDILWETDTDEKYAHFGEAYKKLFPAYSDGIFDTKDKSWSLSEGGNAEPLNITKFDAYVDAPEGSTEWPHGKEMKGAGATWTNIYPEGEVMFIAERNPVLCREVFKWSQNDIMLKLRLLANFYSTYFMPLHMDLLHCAVEDLVFSNAIKQIWWLYYKPINNYNLNLQLDVKADKDIYWLDSNVIIDNYNYQQGETYYPAGRNSAFNFVPFNCTYFDGIGCFAEISTNIWQLYEEKGIDFKSVTFMIAREQNGVVVNDCVDGFYCKNCGHGENVYFEQCPECNGIEIECGSVDAYYFKDSVDYKKPFICLLRHPGIHQIQVMVETFSGDKIISSTNVEVRSDLLKDISIKKLGYNLTNLTANPNWNKFEFDQTFVFDEENYFSYYRTLKETSTLKGKPNVGINHFIKILLDDAADTADQYDADIAKMQLSNSQAYKYQLVKKWYKNEDGDIKYRIFVYYISKYFNNNTLLPTNNKIISSFKYKKIEEKNIIRNEFIFIPLLNNLYDLDGTETEDTVFVLVPEFKASHGNLNVSWKVSNRIYPYNVIEKKTFRNPIITEGLKPGIYDIEFSYQFGDDANSKITRTLTRGLTVN